jgi:hypothetical protein
MSQIIKYCVDYFLKRNIMKVSTIENSFYVYKELNKKISLNQDIIEINYLSESPYPLNKTQIVAITEENSFYLWFNKGKGEYKYYLPEALLLFRQIIKKHADVIFLIEEDINKIIIVRNSNLISTFSKQSINKKDLELIKNQYSIDNLVTLNKEDYALFFEKSFNYLKISDFVSILNIKLDIKSLFNKIIHFSALPLFISVGIISIILIVYKSYLNTQNEELYSQYQESKLLTIKIRDKMENVENLNSVFNALSKEFEYKDKIIAISAVLRVSQELNVTLFYINSYNRNIDFIIKTENASKIPLFTNKLFETKLFSNIKNVSSQKLKNKLIKVTMNAILEHI